MFNRIVAVMAATLILPSLATAADIERGEVLFDTCIGCHGSESYDNIYPTYKVPKLGGQNAEYIAAALAAYNNGERKHPTMVAQAASFDADDVADIAAYIASKGEYEGSNEVVGTAPEAAATCVACHGPSGKSIAGMYPNLGGQHESYLKQAIGDYKSGERSNIQMAPLAQQLSDEDVAAIAAFYAAQKGLVTFEN